MVKKINIRNLDPEIKKKLKEYQKRIKKLAKGVHFKIEVPPIYTTLEWNGGPECSVFPPEEKDIDWKNIAKQEKEIEERVNKEIKEIMDFSDGCAKQLNVNKDVFWNQYFDC